MTGANADNRRLGEWRKFAGLSGVQVDRRSGLERRSGSERRQPDIPTLWMRPERRGEGDRRVKRDRRTAAERRRGEDRRLF